MVLNNFYGFSTNFEFSIHAVDQVKEYFFENQELVQLNISDLLKGIYSVKLHDEEKQVASTRKVIKE